MMEKIAAHDAFAALSEVPGTLRAQQTRIHELASENSELREKVASYEVRDRIEKIASDMEEKGLDAGLSHDEKLEMLRKKASEGSLEVVEHAVKLAAQQGSPFGELGDRPEAGGSLVGYLLEED
jgi:hypothetical protein